MVIEGNKILAEEGKALRLKGSSDPSTITEVYLAPGAYPTEWEDCEYDESSVSVYSESDSIDT